MFRLNRLFHPLKERKLFIGKSVLRSNIDTIFLSLMVIAFAFLGALIWYNVKPIKLLEIKVPVATDQSSYSQGEEISGLFFGENYYTGHVKILREVYCKNYKGVIKPPAEGADGDFFSTRVEPFKYEGVSRRIGNLPLEVPVGSNCVLKFLNIYELQTPFGVREETVEYHTQNFAIISKERRAILDCEANTGRITEQCELEVRGKPTDPKVEAGDTTFIYPQERITEPSSPSSQTNQPTTPAVPETPPNEPITPPQTCTINLLGIKLFCE